MMSSDYTQEDNGILLDALKSVSSPPSKSLVSPFSDSGLISSTCQRSAVVESPSATLINAPSSFSPVGASHQHYYFSPEQTRASQVLYDPSLSSQNASYHGYPVLSPANYLYDPAGPSSYAKSPPSSYLDQPHYQKSTAYYGGGKPSYYDGSLSSTAYEHPSSHLQIKGKAPYVIMWLQTHFEPSEGVSMPRSMLYTHYFESCVTNSIEPVNAASFGKIIRSVFPNLRTRRLGTRGHSKYHYYGIRMKATVTSPSAAGTDPRPSSTAVLPGTSDFFPMMGVMGSPTQWLQQGPVSVWGSPPPIFSLSLDSNGLFPSNPIHPLSCVTMTPPSIDSFASALQKISTFHLEPFASLENWDVFRLGLQHHTTLLLSLVLREDFAQFQQEFTLYWTTVFLKSFPEFSASFFHAEKSTPFYESLLLTIREFDMVSYSVIQNCFLSAFWIEGITLLQLESIKIFATTTLPALILGLCKTILGQQPQDGIHLQLDSNNWPILHWNNGISNTLALKIITIKVDFFKKLSKLLLRRVSFYSLSAVVRGMLAVPEAASIAGGGALPQKRRLRAIISQAAAEIQSLRHKEHQGLSALSDHSASFSVSMEDSISSATDLYPEEIQNYLLVAFDHLFDDGDEGSAELNWESWASFLETSLQHVEFGDDVTMQRKHPQHSFAEVERLQRSLHYILIQWSLILSIFVDQVGKLFVCHPTGGGGGGEDLFSKYIYNHSFESGSESVAAAAVLDQPAGTVVAAMPPITGELEGVATFFDAVRIITEEYLLYLVEKTLDHLKESISSHGRLASLCDTTDSHYVTDRKRTKKLKKKPLTLTN